VQPTLTAAAQATTNIVAPVLGSTTTVQASANPATPGEAVDFTVTVKPGGSANGTPTGTIPFQIDGADVGSPVPLTNDSVTVADSSLALGHHSITAIYTSDNGLFDSSTGILTGGESIEGAVSVAVASSAPQSQYGQGVTFTATVSPVTTGLPALSGTVQFEVDGTPFGAAVPLSGGRAVSPAITTIPAGTHTITAVYANDPNFASHSGSTSQAVARAILTIQANDAVWQQGQPSPTFTATYSGFVNGEEPSSLTVPVVLTTTATSNSLPGVYAITAGGAASPNYAITFVDGTLTVKPAPLVTLTGVQTVTNKKHQVTQIILRFSGALGAAEADAVGTYHLATPGKKGSYTAKGAKTIALSSAVYNSSTDQVTLTARKPFALTKPVQLLVSGTGPAGLQDSFSRLIDGNRDGQPGGNAVAILRRGGVSLARAARGPAEARRGIHAAAVDALLERGEAIESPSGRSELLGSPSDLRSPGPWSQPAGPGSTRDDRTRPRIR
jgi:hypothetical protein